MRDFAAIRNPWPAAAVLLAVPSAALANVGIGYLMVTVPVLLLALLPVIPLEAAVLWRLLRLPFRRALYLSFIANLWSTLVGTIISIVLDVGLATLTGSSGVEFTRGAVAVMLVPMFFITWWLEQRMIVKRLAELPVSRVRRSTFAANLASYAAMIAGVLVLAPATGPGMTRALVSEALIAGSALKTPVHEFWAENKRLPASLKELGASVPAGERHQVSMGTDARIIVRMTRPQYADIHGRHIHLWPVVSGATLEWKCSSPDLDPRLLPMACRERKS